VIQGRENLTYYSYGAGNWRKGFCGTCGGQMLNEPVPLTPQQLEALPPQAKAFREGNMLPTNIRILNDFDFDAIKDKVPMFDGWNAFKPPYVNP
jgi:hypothetical protein